MMTEMWEVEFTDQFGAWWEQLPDAEQESVAAAVEFLQEQGPALRRPFVGSIETSRHANMKELIPMGGHLRVLFAFDPPPNGHPADRRRQDWPMARVVRGDGPDRG